MGVPNQRVYIIGIYSNDYTGLWVILSGIIILVYIAIIIIYNLYNSNNTMNIYDK